MTRTAFRTWIYSATVALALCAVPARAPLHAQTPTEQGTATTTDRDDDRSNLGWLGLLGLVGLLGLRRRHDTHDTTVRTPRT